MKINLLKKDFNRLSKICPTVNKTAKWLRARSYATHVTNVSNIAHKIDVPESEIVAMFKVLEKAGFGSFIKGSHGHKSRFAWSVNTKELTG